MIALFLMLAAQAAAPAADAPSAVTPVPTPPPTRVCTQAPGSDQVVCRAVPQQQLGYRLPRYGPAVPQPTRGKGVKVGAQTTNRGPARRNRSMATVGIPF